MKFILLVLTIFAVSRVNCQTEETCPFRNCECLVTNASGLAISCDSASPVQGFPERVVQNVTREIEIFLIKNYQFRVIPNDRINGLTIRSIAISQSSLENVAENTFNGVRLMSQFALFDANLQHIAANSFTKIRDTLQVITLTNCSLTVERIAPLWNQIQQPRVTTLSLSVNSINTLPFITEFTSLRNYDVSNQNFNLRRLQDYQFERRSFTNTLNLNLDSNNIELFGNRTFCSRFSNVTGISRMIITYNSIRNMNLCVLRQLRSNTFASRTIIEVTASPGVSINNFMDVCNCDMRLFSQNNNIELTGICSTFYPTSCPPRTFVDPCINRNEYSCTDTGTSTITTTSTTITQQPITVTDSVTSSASSTTISTSLSSRATEIITTTLRISNSAFRNSQIVFCYFYILILIYIF